MDTDDLFETVTKIFEVGGVATMVVGFLVAIVLSLRVWIVDKNGETAFRTLRQTFGGVILLGLEILVAADLVKTVTSTPSLTDAVVLGIIVLIRTILSFSLQVEIDGVAPWKRALVTGPQVIARAVKRTDAAAASPVGSPPSGSSS